MHGVFNYLTAHSESDDYSPLLVAPLTLAQGFIGLIHRETEHAAAGRPARDHREDEFAAGAERDRGAL